jgi:hypothetical protein
MSELGSNAIGPSELRPGPGEQPAPAELQDTSNSDPTFAGPDDEPDPYPDRDGVQAENPDNGISDIEDSPPDNGDGARLRPLV